MIRPSTNRLVGAHMDMLQLNLLSLEEDWPSIKNNI